MTPRKIVNRRLRRWVALLFVGFGAFAAGLVVASQILSDNDPKFVFFMLPGVALNIGISIYTLFAGVKCPYCHCNLAPLAFFWPGWRGLPSVPTKYKFCPCCARSFDEPVERPV